MIIQKKSTIFILEKGAPRFELETYRSAVDCSTTELYTRKSHLSKLELRISLPTLYSMRLSPVLTSYTGEENQTLETESTSEIRRGHVFRFRQYQFRTFFRAFQMDERSALKQECEGAKSHSSFFFWVHRRIGHIVATVCPIIRVFNPKPKIQSRTETNRSPAQHFKFFFCFPHMGRVHSEGYRRLFECTIFFRNEKIFSKL